MSNTSTSVVSMFLLVFFALLIACEKTKLPPPEEQENPSAFTFYVYGEADNKPIPDVTVFLYKKSLTSHPLFPTYDPYKQIGKTDSEGKLLWNYPKDSLNSNYQIVFKKTGYYNGSILISNPPQTMFQYALSKVAWFNLHLTYNNDTVPKKFHCIRQYLVPAGHNSPEHYSEDHFFLIHNGVTSIDKMLSIELPLNPSQTIYCYMVDGSTTLNIPHSYPPSAAQLKKFPLPPYARDTTILIEAFFQ